MSDNVKKLIEEFQDEDQKPSGPAKTKISKALTELASVSDSAMHKNKEQVVEEDLAPARYLVLSLNFEIQALQLTLDNKFDQKIVLGENR